MEMRTFTLRGLRAQLGDLEGGALEGYAAMFDSLSEDLGGFVEVIRPGAFLQTIGPGGDDIRALWQHNQEWVLGRTTNGTLRLREDNRGLHVRITPPDTTWARDVVTSIRRGDVDQMSFGFHVKQEIWNRDPETGAVLRELLRVKLFDVSPVTYPAYPSTSIVAMAKARMVSARMMPAQVWRPSSRLDLLYRRLEMAEQGLLSPGRRGR